MKKKTIGLSVLFGLLLAGLTFISVKGATIYLEGYISTSNPIYSAPYAHATTCGYRSLTAECEVSKAGYPTRSTSINGNTPLPSILLLMIFMVQHGPRQGHHSQVITPDILITVSIRLQVITIIMIRW